MFVAVQVSSIIYIERGSKTLYIYMKLDVDRFLNYMYFDVLKIYPRNVGQYLFEQFPFIWVAILIRA